MSDSPANSLLLYPPQVLAVMFADGDATAAQILVKELAALPGIGKRRIESIFGLGPPGAAHLTGFALMVTGLQESPDKWCKKMRQHSNEKAVWGCPDAKGGISIVSSLKPASWTAESARTLLAWIKSYEEESRKFLESRKLL